MISPTLSVPSCPMCPASLPLPAPLSSTLASNPTPRPMPVPFQLNYPRGINIHWSNYPLSDFRCIYSPGDPETKFQFFSFSFFARFPQSFFSSPFSIANKFFRLSMFSLSSINFMNVSFLLFDILCSSFFNFSSPFLILLSVQTELRHNPPSQTHS